MKVINELSTYNGDDREFRVYSDGLDRDMVILEFVANGHTHTVTVIGRELQAAVANALNSGK